MEEKINLEKLLMMIVDIYLPPPPQLTRRSVQ